MIQKSTMLILLCLGLAVKSTNVQDIHTMDVYEGKGGGSEVTGFLVSLGKVLLSRLGLSPTISISGKSLMWPLDIASINEIDSIDFFPPYNVNISTTTEKPDIVQQFNNSDIVPAPNNTFGDSDDERITSSDDELIMSTTDTTTKINNPTTTITEKPNVLWGLWINSSGIVPGPNNSIGDSNDEWITATTNTTTPTTDNPDIVWQFNNSDIVPVPDNQLDDSDDEWITLTINTTTSANESTTNATENTYIVCKLWFNSSGIVVRDSKDGRNTRETIPGHPTCSGVAEFINAPMPFLEPIWTNFTQFTGPIWTNFTQFNDLIWTNFTQITDEFSKEITQLTDEFSKEIMDSFFPVSDLISEFFDIFRELIDFIGEIVASFVELIFFPFDLLDSMFSEDDLLAIEYDSSELEEKL